MALLKFKRSGTPAKAPTIADLELGELALNTFDGKIYMKKDDGTQAIVEIGAGGGGGSGTVTSVAASVPTGFSISGSPITTSGTLAISFSAGYSLPTTTSQTNWDTAYTDRLKWDGGATGLTASTGRTSLGATTVGANVFTLTNPSAITFPRFNADNTVSALSAADFRTAIGAGTGSGTVTSVAASGGTTGLTFTGSPITTSGTLTLGGTLAVANGGTGTTTQFTTGSVVFAGASGVYSQDNANLFWDDTNNRLGIGTTVPVSPLHMEGGLATFQRYGGSGAIALRSAAGTQASPTAIATSTSIGVLISRGYDGTAYRDVAAITATSDGAISSTSSPGFIQFSTTASGSIASTERMRITSAGNVGIGNTPSGSYKLEVTGKAYASGGFIPRVNAQTTTTSPWAWNSDSFDQQSFSALANALTINADAGTPTDGQKTILRFKDNATPRVLTFTGGASKAFRDMTGLLTVSGSNFTYTTTASKTVYFGCVYNGADACWDIIALTAQP